MAGVANGFDSRRKPSQREFKIEKYLVKEIDRLGGRCYKWVSPGCDGVPDRIAVYKGRVVFVEVKRPKEKPRALQEVRRRELQAQGLDTAVVSSRQEVDELVKRLMIRGQRNVLAV